MGGVARAAAGILERLERFERAMGIEPTSKAWEAFVLPLNYARNGAIVFGKQGSEQRQENRPIMRPE